MGVLYDSQKSDVFTTYRTRLKFRDRVMGGIPKDPKIIQAWIRTRMGVDNIDLLRRQTISTMLETGFPFDEKLTVPDIQSLTIDELHELSDKHATLSKTNGFKVDPEIGLYLESRLIKAMLKETTNVNFAGERWLSVKKGPKNTVAERVFVGPARIPLGVSEPSGVELFIGHTTGPRGPQSNMTYYEYVEQATIEFDILVLDDFMTPAKWATLWTHAQENGLGALRSQDFGRFDVEFFEPVARSKRNHLVATGGLTLTGAAGATVLP